MSRYELSHLGLCVTDLDTSLRFYCEGLGFEVGPRFHITRPIAELGPPVDLISQFVRLGDLDIELLGFTTPSPTGRPSDRRNQLGLTHLSFRVDDVDRRAGELGVLGGTVLHDTRFGAGDPASEQILYVADPDGTRVELMHIPPGHDYWVRQEAIAAATSAGRA